MPGMRPTRLLPIAQLLAVMLGNVPDAMAQCPQCDPAGTCGTTVPPGLVPAGQVWTPAGSPYCITGDIQVSLLTIDPGVCVFIDGSFKISVNGTIHADGTQDQPIVFTAKQQNPLTRWNAIEFNNTAPGSSLRYCQIEYSGHSGIRLVNSTPVIENCTISRNWTPDYGGGVYASLGQGTLTLKDCIISDNSAAGINSPVGGGMYIAGSASLSNCLVFNNWTYATGGVYTGSVLPRGGGIFLDGGVTRVSNCVVRNNVAVAYGCCTYRGAWGGGIEVQGGSLSMNDSILSCNYSGSGSDTRASGLHVINAGTADLVNCTFANNSNNAVHGDGGTVDMRNCIAYFNASLPPLAGTVTANYSDIEQTQGTFPGNGNINYNPVFAGSGCEVDDLTIVLGSPCIDAGDPSPADDDGCSPPGLGTSHNDMGAHGGPLGCKWVDAHSVCNAVNYCTSNPNSTGLPARISMCGSSSIAGNDLVLVASDCPPNKYGLFFYGPTQRNPVTPLYAGLLCISGSLTRLHIVNTGSTGTATYTVNYANLPPAGSIHSGDVRNFQFWYRDPAGNPAAPANTTDGLEVFFCP